MFMIGVNLSRSKKPQKIAMVQPDMLAKYVIATLIGQMNTNTALIANRHMSMHL